MRVLVSGATGFVASAILMPFVAHRVFDWQLTEITDVWGLKNY